MAQKKKKENKSTQRQVFGLTILKNADKRIRQLKKDHEPKIHGNKFWNSSYLLMDYLQAQRLPPKARVMEAGCGWGLAGIFCAKYFDAKVTGVDADAHVFPYLDLHAQINEVKLKTRQARFEELKKKELARFDLILGADVCFWDEMVKPLYKMIDKAIKAEVGQIIIADPGRSPFEELCSLCVENLGGETKSWKIEGAHNASGTLLIIGSLP
jgi:2-polyprenyl-3-methyl-5-hydroxy-6-metoxy-1,4-benzoquinol methylase